MKPTRILFIGDLNEYGRSFQRFRTLKDIGYDVTGISHTPVPWNPGKDFSLLGAISWKLRIPTDATGANKKMRQEVSQKKFDIVWIEKGNTVLPSTLRFIKNASPATKLVSVSEDDMYAKHNHSLLYKWGLKYFDIVFTTKVYNLDELKHFGARRTELFLDSYDEHIHHPYTLTEEEKKKFTCDVGFIGSFEKDRAERMRYLAEHGVAVTVWGLDWDAWKGKYNNLNIRGEHLFGEDYSKAICGAKINLCFLRKINRDEVTSRSVEIPACGGFMLGERTKRHLEFFKEGVEAEFFGSDEEMLKKLKYYLAHDEDRLRVAAAGKARCTTGGYSMREQLRKMVDAALVK